MMAGGMAALVRSRGRTLLNVQCVRSKKTDGKELVIFNVTDFLN